MKNEHLSPAAAAEAPSRTLLRLLRDQSRADAEAERDRDAASFVALRAEHSALESGVRAALGSRARVQAWAQHDSGLAGMVAGHWLGVQAGSLVRLMPEGAAPVGGVQDLLAPPAALTLRPLPHGGLRERALTPVLGVLLALALTGGALALISALMPLGLGIAAGVAGAGLVVGSALLVSGFARREDWRLLVSLGTVMLSLASVMICVLTLGGEPLAMAGAGVVTLALLALLVGTQLLVAREQRQQRARAWQALSGGSAPAALEAQG